MNILAFRGNFQDFCPSRNRPTLRGCAAELLSVIFRFGVRATGAPPARDDERPHSFLVLVGFFLSDVKAFLLAGMGRLGS